MSSSDNSSNSSKHKSDIWSLLRAEYNRSEIDIFINLLLCPILNIPNWTRSLTPAISITDKTSRVWKKRISAGTFPWINPSVRHGSQQEQHQTQTSYIILRCQVRHWYPTRLLKRKSMCTQLRRKLKTQPTHLVKRVYCLLRADRQKNTNTTRREDHKKGFGTQGRPKY